LGAGANPAAAGGASFENALSDAMKNAMSHMRVGETAAAQGAAGQGDVVQVVNAVTAAELTLETVVAIRDRVISAYQDIMKMPI
jgi:flagellar hook-basal body complex protein FliE